MPLHRDRENLLVRIHTKHHSEGLCVTNQEQEVYLEEIIQLNVLFRDACRSLFVYRDISTMYSSSENMHAHMNLSRQNNDENTTE